MVLSQFCGPGGRGPGRVRPPDPRLSGAARDLACSLAARTSRSDKFGTGPLPSAGVTQPTRPGTPGRDRGETGDSAAPGAVITVTSSHVRNHADTDGVRVTIGGKAIGVTNVRHDYWPGKRGRGTFSAADQVDQRI